MRGTQRPSVARRTQVRSKCCPARGMRTSIRALGLASALLPAVGVAYARPPGTGQQAKDERPILVASPPSSAVPSRGTEDAPLFVKPVPEVASVDDLDHKQFERVEKPRLDRPMTNATELLALFTFLLFCFTGALWWVTYRLSKDAKTTGTAQSLAMAKSIEEANRSASAMEEVAKATKDNAVLMKGILQKQMRAYLAFESPAYVPRDATTSWRYEIRFSIKNFGHTSAQAVNVNSKLAILSWPIPEDFDPRLDVGDKPGADFATQQTYIFAASLPQLVSDAEIESFRALLSG